MQVYHEAKKCRICSSKNLESVLDLGIQPPANSFLKKVSSSEKKFPLRLFFCKDCFLLQLAALSHQSSKDPSCSIDPETTATIGYEVEKRIANPGYTINLIITNAL